MSLLLFVYVIVSLFLCLIFLREDARKEFKMKIVRILNNNVAQALDDDGNEIIIMGKGIAFGKGNGDRVDPDKIDKLFSQKSVDSTFSDLYRDLSPAEVEMILEIVDFAEKELNEHFQANLYITLADHLHFAMQRVHEGLELTNPLSWEIKKFYKQEYNVGLKILDLIKKKSNVTLPKSEAASIALHFINARKEGGLMEQTMAMVKIVQEILNITKIHYGKEFDEDSISYNRFVTHLQYFAQRVIGGQISDDNDSFLYEQVSLNYPKAMKCAEKIKKYIELTYDFPVGTEEEVYLAIHIQRVTG